MALVQATVAATIKSALNAQYGAPTPGFAEGERDKLSDALATAIIDILTNQTTVNVTSVTGVTTGGGVSGPGTGALS